MWWFALLICREADATSRARNLTVIGAVVAGAFARILAPVVLGLGLEFVLQSAWWRWGLPVVAVLYAAVWWLGSAGRTCFLPTYGRLEQAMQSRFMVRALERSNRSDPRARGRVDESTVGFAIDSAASALREGLTPATIEARMTTSDPELLDGATPAQWLIAGGDPAAVVQQLSDADHR